MFLNKKEQEKKRAIKLLREQTLLYKQKNNIVPIKLDNPIHHGYVRSLELRDDVKQRNDYSKILETINFLGQNKAYHKTKDFIVRVGKTNVEKHAFLRTIADPRFKFYYTEAKRTVDIEKIKSIEKYLYYHYNLYNCSCCSNNQINEKSFRPHYYFKFPWMLTEVTKPYYLTHYTPICGELESRLQEIKNELFKNHYYERYICDRCVYDKIENENWLSTKYGKNDKVIYHSLDEFDETCIIS